LIIDHIGIAVRSITEGIEYWKKVFEYEQLTEIVINTRQKVKVVFLTKKESLTVKLIEPIDETSPVYEFAKKGGGLHHLCFRCDNMEYELRRLNAMSLRILAGPQPGEAFENENIVFVYAKQGLNIELIDTDKKAKRLNDI
jgi:methylmalonyl-CoA/ethylmalonyl-CoA epimerase